MKPLCLCLGAGGSKAFKMLGTLHWLNHIGYLDDIKAFSGCSIGALISLLYVMGYTPNEIIYIGTETSLFSDFFSVPLCIKMEEIKENLGLISHENIRKKLVELFTLKFGKTLTMKELYNATGKELYFSTSSTDINGLTKKEYLSYITNPDSSCIDMILLSINIPGLFYRMVYDNKTYIDGAFTDPLPLKPLLNGKYSKEQILAIYIDSKINMTETDIFITKITKYIHNVVLTSITEIRENIIESSPNNVSFICLRCDTMDCTGVSYSPEFKCEMIIDGIAEGQDYIVRQQTKSDVIDFHSTYNDDNISIIDDIRNNNSTSS